MIAIENLSKRYPRAPRPALDNVSLDIEAGSIFGLLGPNGAGKTTLLSVLAGLLDIDAGSVRLAGEDLGAWKGRLGQVLGFVPQDLAFYPMLTVQENLDFYAGVTGLRGGLARRRIASALDMVQLSDVAKSRADRLSGGLKRRLNLAIGLLNEPRLLCLDEPTVGIDPHSRHYILERIRGLREQGMTVIYTSHYMDEVQRLCDSVAIIEEGQILVQDRVERLLSRYADNRLRIRVNGADRMLQRRVLDAFPHAMWTAVSGELELGADDPLAALSSVREMAESSGARLDSFEYGRTNLEDIYLRVSGKPWEGDDAAAADLD